MSYPVSLEDFFGGNFHQDWVIEAVDPIEVVKKFKLHSTTSECEQIARDIEARLLQSSLSDAELSTKLYKEFGCEYDPSLDGKRTREWLEEVVRVLSPR